MKTEYQAPKITFISIETADVITGSNEGEWDIFKPKNDWGF